MNPTRRNKLPQNPACESLEGRQLLTAGAKLGMAPGLPPTGMNGPADVSMTTLSQVPSGAWGGHDNVGDQFGPQGSGMGISGMPGPGGQGFGGQDGSQGIGMGMMGGGQDDLGVQGSGMAITGMPGLDALGGPFGPGGNFGGMSNGFGGASGGFSHDGPMSFGPGNPTDTGLTDTPTPLQTDMEKLRTDLQAIHDKSQVTPALEATVRDSLKAVQAAATGAADPTALATLQTDIQTARSNPGGPTADQIAQIQADQDAVFKSQGVSDELIAQLSDSLRAVQAAAGVTDTDRATIAADQEAIKADLAAVSTTVTSADPASVVRPMMAGPMTMPTMATRSNFVGFSPNSAPPAAVTDAAATTTDAAVTSVAAATDAATTPTDPPATTATPPAVADPMIAYSTVAPRTMAKGPGSSLPVGAVTKGGTGVAAAGRTARTRSNATGSGTVARAQGFKGLGAMTRVVGHQIMSFGRSFRRPRG